MSLDFARTWPAELSLGDEEDSFPGRSALPRSSTDFYPDDFASLLSMGSNLDSSGLRPEIPFGTGPLTRPFEPHPFQQPGPLQSLQSLPAAGWNAPEASPAPNADLISPNPPAIAPKSKKTERKSRKRTNSSTSDAPPPRKTKVETTEEAKRYQRLMRNRASAQQSRERKKLHLANLEREVQMLRNANSQLTRRVAELEHENNKLRGVDSFHCISGDDFSLSPSSLPHSESSSDHSEASSHPSSPLTGGFLFVFIFAMFFFTFPGIAPSLPSSGRSGRALLSYSHPSVFEDDSTSAPLTLPHNVAAQPQEIDVTANSNINVAESYEDVLDMSLVVKANKPNHPPAFMDVDHATLDADFVYMLSKLRTQQEVPNTYANVSYFFVPSVFSILPTKETVQKTPQTVRTVSKAINVRSDRLLGAPDGAGPNVGASVNSSAFAEFISIGDMIYFWMPLGIADGSEFVETRLDDLFEIGCHVREARVVGF
jgi:hypothetical protein